MKFFHLRTRFWNLPGLLFLRGVYGAAMLAAWAVSPVLGTLARVLGRPHPRADVRGWLVPAVEEERGLKLLRETAARCTFCGACVSTCPAYLLTRDERVSGRAKLGLFEELARRGEVLAGEAHQVFQCFACGLCEEVCQVRLPLRACYTALEGQIEAAFGRPAGPRPELRRACRRGARWIARTFGLELPAWSPPPASRPLGRRRRTVHDRRVPPQAPAGAAALRHPAALRVSALRALHQLRHLHRGVCLWLPRAVGRGPAAHGGSQGGVLPELLRLRPPLPAPGPQPETQRGLRVARRRDLFARDHLLAAGAGVRGQGAGERRRL